MTDYTDKIKKYLELEIQVMKRLDVDAINRVMNTLEEARLAGKTVYICGNGGSAATASHFVCDFNKGVSETQEQKYNFICLNDNIPTMMAVANDISYDEVFVFPLRGHLKPGDLFIGISGSGNSENVVRAARYAKEQGNTVIGITGYFGGKLMELADQKLHVPIDNMQITEDLHMMLDHLMMYIMAYDK
jgi:D-sedoheptulose 7-phosphate isomerase